MRKGEDIVLRSHQVGNVGERMVHCMRMKVTAQRVEEFLSMPEETQRVNAVSLVLAARGWSCQPWSM